MNRNFSSIQPLLFEILILVPRLEGGYCQRSRKFTASTFSDVVLGVDYEFEVDQVFKGAFPKNRGSNPKD